MYRIIRNMTKWLLEQEAAALGQYADLYAKSHGAETPDEAFIAAISEYDPVTIENTPVMVTDHAIQRMTSRELVTTSLYSVIQRHLGNAVVRDTIRSAVIRWSEELECPIPVDSASRITATAVVQEGQPLIPIYEAGRKIVNIRTFLKKQYVGANYFMVGTRVLFLSKTGEILETVDITEGSRTRPDRAFVPAHGRAVRAYH